MVSVQVPSSPSASSRRSSSQRSWTPTESLPSPHPPPPEAFEEAARLARLVDSAPSFPRRSPRGRGTFTVPSSHGTPTPELLGREWGSPSPPRALRPYLPGYRGWRSASPSPPNRRGTWPPSSVKRPRTKYLRNQKRTVIIERGRLGQFQGAKSLRTCVEVPHEQPDWDAVERDEDGVEYFIKSRLRVPAGRLRDGECWLMPMFAGERIEKELACREVIEYRQPGEPEFTEDAAEDVQTLMDHPNLVRLQDLDGFGTETLRSETAWDYCDGGNLNRLLLAKKASGEWIPEPFIWHTIISLLNTVYYLNTGNKVHASSLHPNNVDDRVLPPRKNWNPISHNLIDPTNIFYTKPDQRHRHRAPTCKLGNFTACSVYRPGQRFLRLDQNYVRQLIYKTRTGYEAPERIDDVSSMFSRSDKVAFEFPGVSDIWSIGAVGIAMMTNDIIWTLIKQDQTRHWKDIWQEEGGVEAQYQYLKDLMVIEKGEGARMPLMEMLPVGVYTPHLMTFVCYLLDTRSEKRDNMGVEGFLRKALKDRDEAEEYLEAMAAADGDSE